MGMSSGRAWIGAALLFLCCLAVTACADEAVPSVRVAVQTAWDESSLVYEVAEFLAELHNDLFWAFIDKFGQSVGEGVTFQTAQEEYDFVLSICRQLLSVDDKWLDLLEFALATRHFNARVASHASLADTLRREAIAAGGECSDTDPVARLHWAQEYHYDFNEKLDEITDEEVMEDLLEANKVLATVEELDSSEANLRILKMAKARKNVMQWRSEKDDTDERFTTVVCGLPALVAKLNALVEECNGLPFSACWMSRTMAEGFPSVGDIESAHQLGSRLTFVHAELFADIRDAEFHTDVLPDMKNFTDGRTVELLLRHDPGYLSYDAAGKVLLQSWGAEMALKSTEYRAVDDSEEEGGDASENANSAEVERDDVEVESSISGDLRQLKKWEMSDLGKQASFAAAKSSNPLKVLTQLTGNFPSLAPSLARVEVPNEYIQSLDATGGFFGFGTSMGFINNRFIPDLASFSTHDLLDIAIEEYKMAQDLRLIGIPEDHVHELLKLPFQEIGRMRFNISEYILWLNDLETEERYSLWPSSLSEMLQPAWPGQLRFIAKNIMNVVIVIDPQDKESLVFLNTLVRLIEGQAPFRFGLLLQTYPSYPEMFAFSEKSLRHVIATAFQYLYDEQGALPALKFAASLASLDFEAEEESVDQVLADLSLLAGEEFDLESFLALDANELAYLRTNYTNSVMVASEIPMAFINGVPYSFDLTMQGLTAICQNAVQYDYTAVQRAVAKRHLTDGDSVFDFFVKSEHSFCGYDPLIVNDDPTYINFACAPKARIEENAPLGFNSTLKDGLAAFYYGNVVWASELDTYTDVSHVLITNPSVLQGMKQIHNMLERHSHDDVFGGEMSEVRWSNVVVVPPNRYNIDHTEVTNSHSDLYNIGSVSLPYKKRVKFLKIAFQGFGSGHTSYRLDIGKAMTDIGLGNIRQKMFIKNYSDSEYRETLREVVRFAVTQIFGTNPGSNFVITNGRIVELPQLGRQDIQPFGFKLLEQMERRRNAPLISYFNDHFKERFSSEEWNDMLFKTASVLGSRQADRFAAPGRLNLRDVRAQAAGARLDVRLLLNPLSKAARRVAPMLLAAQEALGEAISVHIEMNPIPILSELPLSSYYRYAVDPHVRFDDNGGLLPSGAVVSFDGLPSKPLFTLGIEADDSWLLQQSTAKYDMDNVVLGNLHEDAVTVYSLEHLVVQGFCVDLDDTAHAPHTLELALKSMDDTVVDDTVVMQNYGYFQLKAAPGQYHVKFASDRSSSVYEFANSASRANDSRALPHYTVAVESFSGPRETVSVRKRDGQEEMRLVDLDIEGSDDGTIHVFTVASGHLYERFLKIMILSSTRQASRPVKFWFLKNYLSPKFIDSVAILAEEFDFEYEFVTYQWPDWIFDQTEKQRKIWAYKILFLDVLFPLNVHRVIFVDADLIVRGDLAELADMDLNGAPYAYTPFCSSREDMDGYRFWMQGFWKDHLGGRPYHISALYVIDLDLFRKTGTGDIVRAIYQSLAPDPNSLSNLDQDLPNYMQAQVPIHSLPQEWLWCETWCDDESKASAKAIDLCNNPLTKSPKLDNAMRVVEEWPSLDGEVRTVEQAHADSLQQRLPNTRLVAAISTACNSEWEQLRDSFEHFTPVETRTDVLPAAEALHVGDIL